MYHFNGAQQPPALYYQQQSSPARAYYTAPQQQPQQNRVYPPQPNPHPRQQGTHHVGQQAQSSPAYGSYSTNQPQSASSYGVYSSNQRPGYQQTTYSANPKYHNSSQSFHSAPSTPFNNSQHSPQACYNCGGAEHWAQNCPEPRRAVPAGSLNNHRLPKRQKTGGPVITRYPPPSISNAHTALQRGYTHPPIGNQQFHPTHGSPTPLPAHVTPNKYWQQPQIPDGVQLTSHTGQRWPPPPIHTPTSNYGSQHASPVSMNSSGLQQSFFPSQATPPVPQSSTERRTTIGSSLHSTQQGSGSFDLNHMPYPQDDSARPQTGVVARVQSNLQEVEHVEPWLEELLMLDFSDHKPGTGPNVSHPANPVAQPLPSDSDKADAIGRLPIAATLPPGVPVSQYFRDLDEEEYERPVELKSEWMAVKEDPAFASINLDCELVSVSDLTRRRGDEVAVLSESEIEEATSEIESEGARGDESDLDRKADADFESDSLLADRHNTTDPEQTVRLKEEQEARLAALGVSGFAKPVQPSVRRTVARSDSGWEQVAEDTVPHSSTSGRVHGDSGSPSTPSGANGHLKPTTSVDESPQGNGHSAQSSPSNSSHDDRIARDRYDRKSRSSDRPLDQSAPPPPSRRHRYFDSPYKLHQSPTELQHSRPEVSHTPLSLRNGSDDQHRDASSPPRSKYNAKMTHKRSYRQSSEESDGGPKRQEDESTRNKRKQPKVAAAYSRRW